MRPSTSITTKLPSLRAPWIPAKIPTVASSEVSSRKRRISSIN